MLERLLGDSPVMQALRERIIRVAATDSRVLILGPNGSGKELIAQALHQHSDRKTKPFVTLNCAAVPSELIESELFGHEKGAFTGAHERRLGRFEQAGQGTLFLDEVGDMPLAMQAKLLRVLQTGAYERIGGKAALSASSVRVLSATNKDLKTEVAAGRFREDLYFRLNVIPLRVPALRDRAGDIPSIAAACIQRSSRPDVELDESAQLALMYHTFPGNVRELENLVERMLILSSNEVLTDVDVREALELEVSPALSATLTASAAIGATSAVGLDVLAELRAQIQELARTMADYGRQTLKTGQRIVHKTGESGIIAGVRVEDGELDVLRVGETGWPVDASQPERVVWRLEDVER